MNEELPAELLHHRVTERDHLAKLPRRIDMKEGERRLAGVERLSREVQHDAGVFPDAVEHHRVPTLGGHDPHDVDALGLEALEVSFSGHGLGAEL